MKEYQDIYLAYKELYQSLSHNDITNEEYLVSICLFLLKTYEDILYYPPYYDHEVCLLSIQLNETTQLHLDNTGILYMMDKERKHIIYDFCDYVTHINDPSYKKLYRKLSVLLNDDHVCLLDNHLISPENIKKDMQSQSINKVFKIKEDCVIYQSNDNVWINVIQKLYQQLEHQFGYKVMQFKVFIRHTLYIVCEPNTLQIKGRYINHQRQYQTIALHYIKNNYHF